LESNNRLPAPSVLLVLPTPSSLATSDFQLLLLPSSLLLLLLVLLFLLSRTF